MNTKITSFIFALVFSFSAIAQKSILFLGGIAHLGNGEVIKNSAISISNGKFDLVADATNIRIDPNAFDTIYKIYNNKGNTLRDLGKLQQTYLPILSCAKYNFRNYRDRCS